MGFISHAASPSNFYVQLTKDESNLNALVENLNAEYSAMAAEENLLSRVKVGQLCCAKFSEDESGGEPDTFIAMVVPTSEGVVSQGSAGPGRGAL